MSDTASVLRRRGEPGERGQITTGLVLLVILGLMIVGLWGVFALSRASDEKSQAQSAADSAALAGAGALDDVIGEILGLIRHKHELGFYVGCGVGQADAATYAARNDAHITAYCFDLGSDTVSVSVEMNDRVSDESGPAVASAIASTGLDLTRCSWEDEEPEETPTPSDPPTDEDPGPPPPPPDIGTHLDCGPLTATFTIGGSDGLLSLVDFHLSGLRPKLID